MTEKNAWETWENTASGRKITGNSIYRELGGLDPALVAQAAPKELSFTASHERSLAEKKKTRGSGRWARWVSLAACLALLLMAGTGLTLWLTREKAAPGNHTVSLGGLRRNYRSTAFSGSEMAFLWPWDEKTLFEKYTRLTFDGKTYEVRDALTGDSSISADLLGEELGSGKAMGHDPYTDKTHTADFAVRKIRGIDEDVLVAAGLDGQFCVYLCRDGRQPATLGELMDTYRLAGVLPLHRFRFTARKDAQTEQAYVLDDDDSLWQILSACREAPLQINGQGPNPSGQSLLQFTATSEALGVYKRAFYISEEGYLWTNLLDYGYEYFIGREAAEKIFSYALTHAEKTDPEPYLFRLAGTLTEIGEGYLCVDDSVLCVDPDEGMVFTVPTDDLRIRRLVSHLRVGDTVRVEFAGSIDTTNGNRVEGVCSVSPGMIRDGEILVNE